MKEDGQLDKLFKNYDELEDHRKDTLLVIGEKLLTIQNIVNDGKNINKERVTEPKTD